MTGERQDDRAGETRLGWRDRYEGSAAQELFGQLAALDFLNWILLFGATLLLSVLPIVILLSAFASHRVDDDIARHLGLNQQGSHIVSSLFRSSAAHFDTAVLLSLIIGLLGLIALASMVQVVYEKAFDQPHHRNVRNAVRCSVWVVCLATLLIADGFVSRPLGDSSAGPVVPALVDLMGMSLFFWWTMHFLLAGREPWGRLLRPALTTAIFWIGLGVFASFYFSSTIVSDSRLYGTIGVVFSLLTWFIGIGAVIMLGALTGLVWQDRS
jgi:membrane protein